MSGSIRIKILISFVFSYSRQIGTNYMATSTLMPVTIFLKKIYNSVLMKVLHLLNYHVLELTAVYVNVAKKLYLIKDG